MGHRARYVNKTALRRLCRHLTPDNALVIETAIETGLRVSDVLHITKNRLIPPNKITFIARKTGKKGEKTINIDLFSRLLRNGNKKFVFPSVVDGRKTRTRQAVWSNMRRAYSGDGRAPSPHSARQAYAVALARQKGIDAVRRELQHTHTDTTISYALADVLQARQKTDDVDD